MARASRSLGRDAGRLLVGVSLLVLVGGAGRGARLSLVVTTSILERAVDELGDAAAGVEVERLIPPGACPGHFDVSPRAVPALRAAAVVVRHEFQGVLEAKLEALGVDDARVLVADAGGSLLIPDHYSRLVRRLAAILAELAPERAGPLEQAAAAADRRLAGLADAIRARPAPWRGARVIASFQQAEFCGWLGLDVVATIGRPEDTSPRDLGELLGFEPDLVVGNLQEGLEAAAAVADRLAVPLVVFSNFPGADGYGRGYDELMMSNLDRLDAAWGSR